MRPAPARVPLLLLLLLLLAAAFAGCAEDGPPEDRGTTTQQKEVLDEPFELSASDTEATFDLTFPAGTREARFELSFSGLAPGYTMTLGSCSDEQTGQSFPGTATHVLTCGEVGPGPSTATIRIDTGTLSGQATITALVEVPR